jgi:transposase
LFGQVDGVPPFSRIGEFVHNLIQSTTEVAARAGAQEQGQGAVNPGILPTAVEQTSPVEPLPAGKTLVSEDDSASEQGAVVPAERPRPSEPLLGGETDDSANAPPPSESTTHDRKSWQRWTAARIRIRIKEVFGIDASEEAVRLVLRRLGLSWKKAKKLLSKADPEKRRAFVADIRALLDRVLHDENLVLAYIDEAHIHQDADIGYGWSRRGRRLYVASSSPGLSAKVSFYGVYLYSDSQVRIWEYPKANGEHTIDVLKRLRSEFAERPMIVLWDGASYHRSACVLEAAAQLDIRIVRLPAYSPDFMPVEALWRWLRESVTYNHCHDTAVELISRVAAFVKKINREACALADRLWVKTELDPDEENLRFST